MKSSVRPHTPAAYVTICTCNTQYVHAHQFTARAARTTQKEGKHSTNTPAAYVKICTSNTQCLHAHLTSSLPGQRGPPKGRESEGAAGVHPSIHHRPHPPCDRKIACLRVCKFMCACVCACMRVFVSVLVCALL